VNEDELACTSGPGALVTALSNDISDGVFDGTRSGTPISYVPLTSRRVAGTHSSATPFQVCSNLAAATSGFTFGGINNELTMNGVDASDVAADVRDDRGRLSAPLHHPSTLSPRQTPS